MLFTLLFFGVQPQGLPLCFSGLLPLWVSPDPALLLTVSIEAKCQFWGATPIGIMDYWTTRKCPAVLLQFSRHQKQKSQPEDSTARHNSDATDGGWKHKMQTAVCSLTGLLALKYSFNPRNPLLTSSNINRGQEV